MIFCKFWYLLVFHDVEWESIDCGGIDIDGNGEKGLTKAECKARCDSDSECSFVVHGGPGGARGSSYDWWANRCVPRKHLNLPCPRSTWMLVFWQWRWCRSECGICFINWVWNTSMWHSATIVLTITLRNQYTMQNKENWILKLDIQ